MERLLHFQDLSEQVAKGQNLSVEQLQRAAQVRKQIYQSLLQPAEQRLQVMKKKEKQVSEQKQEQSKITGQVGQVVIEGPVAVLGDASGSMEVAIRVSTVISALFSAICNAQLRFFNGKSIVPSFVPSNADQVVELTRKTKATGATAPAAALWDFFSRGEIIKTFILVTDEEETTPHMGMSFAKLFEKYHQQVFPAKLVFFSFIQSNTKGKMTAALERLGFQPLVFRFDGQRPDLTKIDVRFTCIFVIIT